jgi:hypothetical protein
LGWRDLFGRCGFSYVAFITGHVPVLGQ